MNNEIIKRNCGICKKEFNTAKELIEHLKICKGVKFCLELIDIKDKESDKDERI